MKNVKKLIVLVTAIGVLGLSGIVYAADIKTPADIAAAVTGKSITDVNTEHDGGKTYGTIAKDAGKLDEFKTQMLEQRKAALEQRVKDGTLTQQQADQILTRINNNRAACNGTGNEGLGGGNCAGLGQGNMGAGRNNGAGTCDGSGFGGGMGAGRGINK